jgi:ATP-dependent DNA helicase RecG
MNDFISKQVSLGGQCYIVCPSIENENDDEETYICDFETGEIISENELGLKNVMQYSEELKASLPHLTIGILHGKMKPREKDLIMESFKKGETHVLVSTTVIEVGVNVPNANIMIVENADRFGLSQLHQLRGRVGRGERKSYCILVSDNKSTKSRERLGVMRRTYDGFEIAEKDLLLRGPGDYFASVSDNNLRQSGGFEFKFASMCDSTELLEAAFATAKTIVKHDPDLSRAEHAEIKKTLERHISINSSTIS